MSRPDIPAEVQREVRRRCGFGCVLCGLPLYHYDHIVDWSKVKEHAPENITLLCAAHHDQKTRGLLTREQVAEANNRPANVAAGTTAPFGLNFEPTGEVLMIIGGELFRSPSNLFPIVVDNQPIVGFVRDTDGLHLYLDIRDRYNCPVLVADGGELVVSAGLWDVELTGRVLTLRSASREILLAIEFNPPNCVRLTRARLMMNGVLLDVSGDTVRFNQSRVVLSQNMYDGAVGLTVGYCPNFPQPIPVLRHDVDRYE